MDALNCRTGDFKASKTCWAGKYSSLFDYKINEMLHFDDVLADHL
jgi:hypothetical protein